MKLLFSIAWTHVSSRVRQTLVGMAGVSMGVGFTIMMAGLMQGSQIDFLRQLVDTMPLEPGNDDIDPAVALRVHASYDALDSAGALLKTGPTGTNVNDLVITLLS